MTTVGYATLEIIPSMKGFSSALQGQTGGALAKTGSKAGETTGRSFKSSFASGIKGVVAPLTAAFAAVKVVDFVGNSLAQAREAQKAGALTAAAIKSTGGAANVTAAQVAALATAISDKVGVDDEAIQSGENLLLTFTNIRNETGKGNDIFNQATQSITDMSAALGQDMKSGAIQLGKALNDPIKGITALSRVGVAFTDQQKAQITAMVEAGNTMGAQKVILAELTTEFGGAAAAQATAGDRAKVAFENLQEEIGTKLLPVVDALLVAFVDKGIPAIEGFGNGLASVVGFVQDNADVIAPLAAAVGAAAVAYGAITLATAAWTAVTTAATGAQLLFDAALAANPISIVIIAVAALAAGIVIAYKRSETFRDVVSKAMSVVGDAFHIVTHAVGVVAKAFLNMGAFAVDAFATLLDAALATFDLVLQAADKGLGWIPGIGDKIHDASSAFQSFRESAVNDLHAVADNLRNTAAGINRLPDKKTITIETKYVNTGAANTLGAGLDYFGHALPSGASGRPNTQGGVTVVHNGDVVVPDSAAYLRDMQRRSRAGSAARG